MVRPENILPPELYYGEEEAKKYTRRTRITRIQAEMAERCLELLELDDEPMLLLDLGCGSGLSGEILSENGHVWIGLDISRHMLAVAQENDAEGLLFRSDLGEGLFFRPGLFDGAISISVLQWLCNADKTDHIPRQRIRAFFTGLQACLSRNAKAVFQFYPETPNQTELLLEEALKAGFGGGLVIDHPESTKKQKKYLFLTTGMARQLPLGIGEKRPEREGRGRKQAQTRRERIQETKEKRRRKGRVVPVDTKYTGRRRGPTF